MESRELSRQGITSPPCSFSRERGGPGFLNIDYSVMPNRTSLCIAWSRNLTRPIDDADILI
jgi:hypothetical protein